MARFRRRREQRPDEEQSKKRFTLTRCTEIASLIGTVVGLVQYRKDLVELWKQAKPWLSEAAHALGTLNTMHGEITWPAVLWFAGGTEVLGVALALIATHARLQHQKATGLLDEREREYLWTRFKFFGWTCVYYAAFPFIGSAVLPRVILELVNLMIGHSAIELSFAINPGAAPPRGSFKRYRPSLLMIALGGALFAVPALANHLFPGTHDFALKAVTAFGPSLYVAYGGYCLWKANDKASPVVRGALEIYFWGLLARTCFVFAGPALWVGLTGIFYFAGMTGKFACIFVDRMQPMAATQLVPTRTRVPYWHRFLRRIGALRLMPLKQ